MTGPWYNHTDCKLMELNAPRILRSHWRAVYFSPPQDNKLSYSIKSHENPQQVVTLLNSSDDCLKHVISHCNKGMTYWQLPNWESTDFILGSQGAPLELQHRLDALEETSSVACTGLKKVTKEFSLHAPRGSSISSIGYSQLDTSS